MRKSRFVAGAAAGACMVVAGMMIGLPELLGSSGSRPSNSSDTPTIHNQRVSLLSRAATVRDRLPRPVRVWPFARHHYGQGHGSRLAYANRTDRVFVVPARRGELCLVRVSYNANAGTCDARARLKVSSIYLASRLSGGKTFVVGIASDGWQTVGYGAQRAPIRTNVYAIEGSSSRDVLTLRAEGAASRSIRLGP